jgi:putative transport protein
MTLGVILGLIPIPLPGGTALRLGLAGGPLVVGLILGHREHTGPFTGVIPLSANLALRQIGLVLFQAGVGTRAGFGFVETVHTSGVEMILAGGLITAGVALASLFVGHRLLKRPFESVVGLTCAIHREPASPGFCQPHIPFRRPTSFVRASFPGVHGGQDCPCASCWWRGDRRAKG